MATIHLTPTTLSLRLTRFEKIAGLLRDVEVSRSVVVGAEVVDEPLRNLPGMRAPGFGLPGVRAIGTWRRRGQRTLVCVRRGQPAVLVRLTGVRYDALLVGDDRAAESVRSLTAAS
jgi:hypothetical protein